MAKKDISVMRVLSKDGEFVVQQKAIAILNHDEKKKLKTLLESIIKLL